MTKKYLLPIVASATLCSLALCNCSSISNYRKDPSEWNTPGAAKPKVEKVSKQSETNITKKKSGGLFGFISKYRKDPKEWDKSGAKPEVATKLASNPTPNTASLKTPRVTVTAPSVKPRYVKQPRVTDYATLPVVKNEKTTRTGVRKTRRQVGGLLNPDADKLPTKKDLQEIQSTIPKAGSSSGVNIPVKP